MACQPDFRVCPGYIGHAWLYYYGVVGTDDLNAPPPYVWHSHRPLAALITFQGTLKGVHSEGLPGFSLTAMLTAFAPTPEHQPQPTVCISTFTC